MLKNHLAVALRNVRRQPGYTILNILGLTLGIAATLFILLYVFEETRFDTFHTKADRIYRVSADITEPDDHFRWAQTQVPLAPQLKEDYAEVEEFVRFIPNGRTRLQYGENFFFDDKIFLVDSTLCDVFDFEFLQGQAKEALKAPNSIALSQTLAQKIFGANNPIGEVLKTPSGREYKVTGVYKDMPHHAHLIPNGMISTNTFPGLMNPNAGAWGGFGNYNFVLLKEGADARGFAAKLPEVVQKYVAVIFDEMNIKVKYELIALKDIHLKSDFENEPEPPGQIAFLYVFGAVGLFLLLIACINYMNLATARATKRALEVGIRKVLGSDRRQLIGQFLSESVLFTVIALVLSFGLVHLLLPLFNHTFDLELGRSLLWSPQLLAGALGIVLLTGVLGGSYPAFFLSAFQPIKVLKGTLSKGSGNPNLRKVLVGVQFAITIFMLIGTGIIYDQMHYLRTKNLGFDKDHVLTFDLQGQQSREKFPLIREKLLQNHQISAVATCSTTPGQEFGKAVMNIETADGAMSNYGVDNYAVDYDFFPALGMTLVAGRNFSREYGSDSTSAVMVNEAMVRRMNWKDPIGRKFQFGTQDTLPVYQVVGVVKDFHQRSLYEPIEPILFYPQTNNGIVHVRFTPSSGQTLSGIISFVEKTWQEIFPNTPFEYDFVDASFMELYHADQIRARIFTLFSVLMIFIACLGLLGLASFTAEQRTKEIGIRKVLGAGAGDLVYILTRNFLFLVALATVPAFIAAWYFMNKWLDTFAYHTGMNFWLYGLAFLLVVVITLFTTGYFAVKAAWVNPVKSLRSE